ncbi:MAG: transcription antitermination factor NusB [Pseudomonadota bacterium]
MAKTGVPARQSAVYVLDQILGDHPRLMSDLIASGALNHLSPPDRARAQRLATDTLRGLERADRLLQKHLSKYPPLTVRNALRLGTVELAQGAAAHGVVNAIVTLVSRHKRFGHLKGLTNAVLRKVAADLPRAWDALRAPRLPKWLRDPLVAAWGAEAMSAMEAAHFAGAPIDLTAKSDPQHVAQMVNGQLLPTNSIRLQGSAQISALPGYDAGEWWVQDVSAALPAKLLRPQPGEQIADLCAAPGGKTLQLAAAGADVTAVDSSLDRMQRVKENLERVGLQANILIQDAREIAEVFDAVLLDAPCSATGTLRRHPDLPYAKDGSDFSTLIDLQKDLLAHAVTLLKPGGRLVFCTCSLLPDEGEMQIIELLKRQPDLSAEMAHDFAPGIDQSWVTEEGGLRIRPDFLPELGGMDGFYMARLRKNA